MVDLPTIQNRVPEIEAPRSRVTPGDVASPFQHLAKAMQIAGHETGVLAQDAAKQAGYRAVSSDKDGNIQVEAAPIVGPAAEVYRRAVKMGALVQGEGTVRRDVLAMRREYEGDPQGFQTALQEYQKKKIKQYDEAAGAEVGLAIGRIIDRTGTQVFRGLVNRKQRADVQGASDAVLGRADSLSDDISSLAEGGADNTPEFASAVGDYRALLKEAADNPLIDFSPQQAALHFDRTMERAKEAAFVGGVRQAYAAGGPEGARDHFNEHIEASGWTPQQRARMQARVDDEIESLDATADRMEIDRARAPVIAAQSREQEGYERLAAGEMSQGWIDRYGDDIDPAARSRFRLAMEATGGQNTVPAVHSDLTALALANPALTAETAADALITGQVTRADYAAANRLAAQVSADQTARPWANDLRRTMAGMVMGERAAQRGPALAEVSDWLAANPDALPEEARKYADTVVRGYLDRDRQTMRATLPPLRFAAAAEPGAVDQAEARVFSEAAGGRMGLADIVAQSRLAGQWRDALTKDA